MDIAKGDKIRVVKGDLTGISGTVVTIEDKQVIFKPNIEGFNDIMKYDAAYVVKFFEPGDDVRVIEGKYKGETGIVTKLDGSYAYISLDQSNREIKIFANYLKLKSELDQNILPNLIDKKKSGQYQANDLISYNNNKNVGVVL